MLSREDSDSTWCSPTSCFRSSSSSTATAAFCGFYDNASLPVWTPGLPVHPSSKQQKPTSSKLFSLLFCFSFFASPQRRHFICCIILATKWTGMEYIISSLLSWFFLIALLILLSISLIIKIFRECWRICSAVMDCGKRVINLKCTQPLPGHEVHLELNFFLNLDISNFPNLIFPKYFQKVQNFCGSLTNDLWTSKSTALSIKLHRFQC